MTLQDKLNLLPDNNTGAIDAVQLRSIVTDLYYAANLRNAAYSFNTGITGSVNNGKLRYNNADATLVTQLGINKTTDDGVEIGSGIASLPDLTLLRVRDRGDSTRWHQFQVNGAVMPGTGNTYLVPVIWQSQSGVFTFNGNTDLLLIVLVA